MNGCKSQHQLIQSNDSRLNSNEIHNKIGIAQAILDHPRDAVIKVCWCISKEIPVQYKVHEFWDSASWGTGKLLIALWSEMTVV